MVPFHNLFFLFQQFTNIVVDLIFVVSEIWSFILEATNAVSAYLISVALSETVHVVLQVQIESEGSIPELRGIPDISAVTYMVEFTIAVAIARQQCGKSACICVNHVSCYLTFCY
jgi:hypothetical protein